MKSFIAPSTRQYFEFDDDAAEHWYAHLTPFPKKPSGDHILSEAGEWVLPAPAVPQVVTPAQGLMALYENHAITEADIGAAIASIEDTAQRYQATIAFTRATSWERASVSMSAVAQLMQLTEADLDAAFTLAATYTNL